MNKTLIYIVGGTVLVGGAYLFLKNKKAKDLSTLAELGGATTGGATTVGATSGGTTSGGTTSGGTKPPLSTTSDGVAPSDANLNLANATVLANEIKAIDKEMSTPFMGQKTVGGMFGNETPEYRAYNMMSATYKIRREPKVTELAKLGYKLDAIGQLVKI